MFEKKLLTERKAQRLAAMMCSIRNQVNASSAKPDEIELIKELIDRTMSDAGLWDQYCRARTPRPRRK